MPREGQSVKGTKWPLVAALTVLLVSAALGILHAINKHQSADSADLAKHKAELAAKDSIIARQDAAAKALHITDSVKLVVAVKQQQANFDRQRSAWERVKVTADTGLVPASTVIHIQHVADSTITACVDLSTAYKVRVDNLLAQIAVKDSARANVDTVIVYKDAILKDTVAILRPPWFKRTLGWIGDHVVTVAGTVLVVLGTQAILKARDTASALPGGIPGAKGLQYQFQ